MSKIKTLTIRFKNELRRNELPMFRGAIISAVDGSDILYHNHTEDCGFRYKYPLIQYKRIGGKAAIICVGDGTEAIGSFFSNCNFDIRIGERPVLLEVEQIKADQTLIQIWDNDFEYTLRKWLPFNQENYEQYLKLESLSEKYAMLERLLIGNMLSFAKGVGVTFDKQVECKITEVSEPLSIVHKGVKLMGFDVSFKSNVSLPDFIGLGKGVSVGKGMVKGRERKELP